MLASVFNVSPPMSAVTIAGGRGALIQRTASGPTFEVRNGGDLTIRGISFTRGVECARSTLAVRGAGFDAPTETRSWMVLDQCTTSVDGCELLNSSSQGIEELNSGHLTVTNTKVARSAGNGVRALDVFSIERSTIESNLGVGILASTQSAVVARCSISLNRGGGLSVVGGRFDVTNNFITRNGTEQPPVSLFGGMRLQTGLSGNRVEHNTVVRNDTDPGSMYAGGIYCEGGGNFTNNLIANNFAGNASLPNAQTGGNCNQVGSLVSADDSPFHFVRSNVEPFDYHLADAQSIAANVGMVTSQPQAVDFDGDARSDGMPDVGADELEQ